MKVLPISLVLCSLVLIACKKEEPLPNEVVSVQNTAPCTLLEKVFPTDSLFYGNSTYYPEAKFSVKFIDTIATTALDFIEFGFNHTPTTGMYYMVNEIDTNSQVLSNQISFKMESGGMLYQAFGTNDPIIYVENNTNELIISYCNIPNQIFTLDPPSNSYIGNGEGNLLYKIIY
jgi:hypothetical protein